MAYKVHELAEISGVTPRTLHYYDSIGLLEPAGNSAKGYRLYEEKELLRLQQILFYRELGFELEQIKSILDSPGFNLLEALADQKELLQKEGRRLNKLVKTLDKTIDRLKGKSQMSDQDMYEGFSKEEKEKLVEYQKEAEARWGNTEAYKQSQQRYAKLSKEEKLKMKEDGEEFCRQLASVMDRDPASPEVQAMVAQHWQGINFFYDCTPEIYRGLAEMYVADQRFADYYNKFAPGLNEFLAKAMLVYCDKLESK